MLGLSNVYEYEPLPSSPQTTLNTRFLRVLPRPDSCGRVQSTLFTSQIALLEDEAAKTHQYHALSYMWGDETDFRDIVIDGRTLSIRKNLYDFLAVAQKAPELSELSFWIDAVCINQRDLEERSEQVKSMDRIYAKAEGVVVWLGVEDVSIEQTIKTVRTYKQLHPNELRDNSRTNADYEVLRQEQTVLKLFTAVCEKAGKFGVCEFWNSMYKLYGLQYWRRAWILQELYFGRNIILWYGMEYVSLDEFNSFVNPPGQEYGVITYENATDFQPEVIEMTPIKGYGSINAHLLRYNRRQYDLRELFENINHSRECSDVRDKLYAFRSMLKERDQLEVDYTESADLLMLRLFPFSASLPKPLYLWDSLATRFGHKFADFRTRILKTTLDIRFKDLTTDSTLSSKYSQALDFVEYGEISFPAHNPPREAWVDTTSFRVSCAHCPLPGPSSDHSNDALPVFCSSLPDNNGTSIGWTHLWQDTAATITYVDLARGGRTFTSLQIAFPQVPQSRQVRHDGAHQAHSALVRTSMDVKNTLLLFTIVHIQMKFTKLFQLDLSGPKEGWLSETDRYWKPFSDEILSLVEPWNDGQSTSAFKPSFWFYNTYFSRRVSLKNLDEFFKSCTFNAATTEVPPSPIELM